jgi:Phage integrase, N-terminal SAM-like domain
MNAWSSTPLLDHKLGQVAMALLDLHKLTAGLSRTWAGFLTDWDRSLRSANYPETTRYNYLLAAAQLARYLAEYSPDPDADTAADDPAEVTRAHVEAFYAWMMQRTRCGHACARRRGPSRHRPGWNSPASPCSLRRGAVGNIVWSARIRDGYAQHRRPAIDTATPAAEGSTAPVTGVLRGREGSSCRCVSVAVRCRPG